MSIADDIRSYAENALEEAKKAAEEGRKPFYALIGLNDLAMEQTRQFAEKAQQQIDEYRENMTDRIANFRTEFEKSVTESREKAQELPKLLSSLDLNDVQQAVQDYAANMQKFYESLTERGEKLVNDLTKQVSDNPVVKRIIEASEQAQEQTVALINRSQSAARDAQGRAQAAYEDATKAARATAARTGRVAERNAETARDAAEEVREDLTGDEPAKTAKKPTAKKATAKKATAAKAPAKKTAKKTAPKES